MSVYIVASIDFPEGMASTACVSLMAKGLASIGADVRLLIPNKSFNGNMDSVETDKGIYNNIPFMFFNKHSTKGSGFSLSRYKNSKDLADYLVARKKNGNDDIVVLYGNNFFHYYNIFIACKRYNIYYFPWEVEKYSSLKAGRSIKSHINYWGFIIGEKFIINNANGLFVISSQLKKFYGSHMDIDRIHISPIMIDFDESDEAMTLKAENIVRKKIDTLKVANRVIVYSGSFSEKDGFPYILKAFSKYTSINKNVVLIATGKPSKQNPIKNILKDVDDIGITDRFFYLGLVSRKELQYINNEADLLLVCRSNSEFAHYGFPWKLSEYLLTKKPIIATRVGDIESYFSEDEIFMANAEDSDSIFTQIDRAMMDYENAKIIALNGYKKAKSIFDYKMLAKDNYEFIQSAIKE